MNFLVLLNDFKLGLTVFGSDGRIGFRYTSNFRQTLAYADLSIANVTRKTLTSLAVISF
jgi:hypothetical protein